MGNLCANCHQARRYMPNFASKDANGAAIAGQYDITSRFNPHLSNQSDMLLGVGGGGEVAGSPAAHYTMTTDSCVTCHLGESANHTFEASVSACVACHTDAEDLDINGAVPATQAKFDALLAALIEAGLVLLRICYFRLPPRRGEGWGGGGTGWYSAAGQMHAQVRHTERNWSSAKLTAVASTAGNGGRR